MSMKVCRRCGEEFPIDSFWRDKSRKDGRANWCKDCSTENQRGLYRRSKNLRDYHKRRNQRVRLEVLAHLCESKLECMRCGFSDVHTLQVDHIYGKGSQETKQLGGRFYLQKKILGMPKEEARKYYQVLCANCNVIKRAERNESVWKYPDP